MKYRNQKRVFEDRFEAGEVLSKGNTIVLAIPSGGVPVGIKVAENLQSEVEKIYSASIRQDPVFAVPEAYF